MCIPYYTANKNRTILLKQAKNLHDSVEGSNEGSKIWITFKISEDTDAIVYLTNKYFLLLKGAYYGFSISSEAILLMWILTTCMSFDKG